MILTLPARLRRLRLIPLMLEHPMRTRRLSGPALFAAWMWAAVIVAAAIILFIATLSAEPAEAAALAGHVLPAVGFGAALLAFAIALALAAVLVAHRRPRGGI